MTSTIPVDQVLGETARMHSLQPEQLTAADAADRHPAAHREAVWLCYRHLTGYSAPRIGRLLGIPRSQVTRAVRDVDQLRTSDPQTTTRLELLAQLLPAPSTEAAA